MEKQLYLVCSAAGHLMIGESDGAFIDGRMLLKNPMQIFEQPISPEKVACGLRPLLLALCIDELYINPLFYHKVLDKNIIGPYEDSLVRERVQRTGLITASMIPGRNH